MSALDPIEILNTRNIVGEGILWDWRRSQLWWTDIPRRKLYRYDWAGGTTQILDTPERVGSFGLVENSESLIVAFASGIALYDPNQKSIDWMARPEEIVAGIRFNDGRVDRLGRFWSGTMIEDGSHANGGSLYSMSGARALRRHFSGIAISNGLCLSPDGGLLYFADSPTRTIRAFDMIEPEGTLGNSRVFAQTPDGSAPDGACHRCGRLHVERALGRQLRRSLHSRRTHRPHPPCAYPPAKLCVLRRPGSRHSLRHQRARGNDGRDIARRPACRKRVFLSGWRSGSA